MKRKHYLLSVEIGGVENYAVRNLACIVGYKLSTDPAKAETFGENIKKRWLAQYPSGRAVAVGDEQRPDLEELRQIKRELQGPLREKPRKFGPRMPPKLGPVRPRAVKFGPRKPTQEEREFAAQRARDMKPAAKMLPVYMGENPVRFLSSPLRPDLRPEPKPVPVPKFEANESPFIVSMDEETPRDYEPITPQHLPGNLTRDQLREWFIKHTGRLPIIPAGVKDGVSWARARAVEAADEAHRIMMLTGGSRLWAYFRPTGREDAPLTTEKFGANLRFAPVGTIVQWKIPYETFGRIYRKMGGGKFDWKEILPGPQGWRSTSTRGELVLRNIIANYNQAPAQFSILFPSDPKAEVYKLEAAVSLNPRLSEERQILKAEAAELEQQEKAVDDEENILAIVYATTGTILLEWEPGDNLPLRAYRKMGPDKLEWREIIKSQSAFGWKFLRAREGTTNSAASLFRDIINKFRARPNRWTLLSIYDAGGRYDMSRDPADRYTKPEPGMSDGEKAVEVEDPARMRNFAKTLSDVSDRVFWDEFHDTAKSYRPAYERDAIAAELAKRVKKYNGLKGRALRMAGLNMPGAFITYADGIKTGPYLVNLPADTILQVSGPPTKGYKNPVNSLYILQSDGTWRELKMTGWNYETVYAGGNTLSDVARKIAAAKPSEIRTFKSGSKEHARFMDQASSAADVTPAVVSLLREYMTGSRKKDAPGGIIRKYGPIDFHLLTRALSAKLIERADMNDKEAIKLTDKGRALL